MYVIRVNDICYYEEPETNGGRLTDRVFRVGGTLLYEQDDDLS